MLVYSASMHLYMGRSTPTTLGRTPSLSSCTCLPCVLSCSQELRWNDMDCAHTARQARFQSEAVCCNIPLPKYWASIVGHSVHGNTRYTRYHQHYPPRQHCPPSPPITSLHPALGAHHCRGGLLPKGNMPCHILLLTLQNTHRKHSITKEYIMLILASQPDQQEKVADCMQGATAHPRCTQQHPTKTCHQEVTAQLARHVHPLLSQCCTVPHLHTTPDPSQLFSKCCCLLLSASGAQR